jgi:hypothetical protein
MRLLSGRSQQRNKQNIKRMHYLYKEAHAQGRTRSGDARIKLWLGGGRGFSPIPSGFNSFGTDAVVTNLISINNLEVTAVESFWFTAPRPAFVFGAELQSASTQVAHLRIARRADLTAQLLALTRAYPITILP